MSFKSYACAIHPDGHWFLTDPKPLVFSGRHGLIARFIAQEKERAAGSWKLCPGELHALALPGDLVRDRVIVFEQTNSTVLELLWLRDVRGISSSTTEMLFTFTPLVVAQGHPMLVVHEQDTARSYGEDLTLDGGVTNPAGNWCWRKPHLALGGVRLGPAAKPEPHASSHRPVPVVARPQPVERPAARAPAPETAMQEITR